MPPARIDAVMQHPAHVKTVESLPGFISDLRMCQNPGDFVAFQENRLSATLAATQARAVRSRVAKRLRKGQKLPPDAPELPAGAPYDGDAWELELDVYERVIRQLRSIGDALAWRVLGYNRSYILALCRNESPGPMHRDKKGTQHEIEFAAEQWRDHRRFTLLHDLTDCLRIGDATVFHDGDDGWQNIYLHELKSNPNARDRVQDLRLKAAAEATQKFGRLPGDIRARLVDTGVPYATHLPTLADALSLAHQRGIQTMKIPGGRALLAFDFSAARNRWGEEEAARRFESAHSSLLRRARLTTGTRICYSSGGSVARGRLTPPWGIYPLQPAQCAALIADFLVFTVTLRSDSLVEELGKCGMDAGWLLPDGVEPTSPGQPVLELRSNGHRVSMNSAEINRLLLELVDLPTWVRGMDRVLAKGTVGWQPWPVFTNEDQIWV